MKDLEHALDGLSDPLYCKTCWGVGHDWQYNPFGLGFRILISSLPAVMFLLPSALGFSISLAFFPVVLALATHGPYADLPLSIQLFSSDRPTPTEPWSFTLIHNHEQFCCLQGIATALYSVVLGEQHGVRSIC